MMCERTSTYWYDMIAPAILRKKKVVVVAHESSLKALVKVIEGKSETEIANMDISSGSAIVYSLDANLKPLNFEILRPTLAQQSQLHMNTNTDSPSKPGDAFWSAELREMQIYSAEQIIVPDTVPALLKNYCKEVIRAQPQDIIEFSREYPIALLTLVATSRNSMTPRTPKANPTNSLSH